MSLSLHLVPLSDVRNDATGDDKARVPNAVNVSYKAAPNRLKTCGVTG